MNSRSATQKQGTGPSAPRSDSNEEANRAPPDADSVSTYVLPDSVAKVEDLLDQLTINEHFSEAALKIQTSLPEISDEELKGAAVFLIHYFSKSAEQEQVNHELPDSNESIARFFSVSKAECSVAWYIERLLTHLRCSNTAMICAMIYIERIQEKHQRLTISAYTMHRLFITSLMIAAKIFDDPIYLNSYYARVGGIPSLTEMNQLEIEFLKRLDYETFVSAEKFEDMVKLGKEGSGEA